MMTRVQDGAMTIMIAFFLILISNNGKALAFILPQQQNGMHSAAAMKTISSPSSSPSSLYSSSSSSSSSSLEEKEEESTSSSNNDITNNKSWHHHLDAELMSLSEISDDAERRDKFEIFVRAQIQEEYDYANNGSMSTSIRELPFIADLNDRLAVLGKTVQDRNWERHISGKFGSTTSKPTKQEQNQLWACVDMLIQYKVLIRRIEEEQQKTNESKN